MKTISIDKPCDENWAAMTPSQKGAFCGKCQIDVVDFSNKTATEVKLILQENVGKHMCGRFKKTQLDDLNLAYTNWDTQDARTFQSKFVYALVVVFGMTLFSCNTPEEIIMGDFESPSHIVDSTSKLQNTDGIQWQRSFSNFGLSSESETDTTKKPTTTKEYEMGKYAYVEEVEIKPTLVLEENEYIKGDMAYTPDTINNEEPIIDTITTAINSEIMATERYILGEIYVPEAINTDPVILEKSSVVENDPAVSNCTNTLTANFSASLFPNPTGGIATVVILIEADDNFTIELFDVTGKRLALVYSGPLSTGQQQFAVAMHNYQNGTFILVITNSISKQILKIQKID